MDNEWMIIYIVYDCYGISRNNFDQMSYKVLLIWTICLSPFGNNLKLFTTAYPLLIMNCSRVDFHINDAVLDFLLIKSETHRDNIVSGLRMVWWGGGRIPAWHSNL